MTIRKQGKHYIELEYRERELTLKEHELFLRKRETKVHVMELSNRERT